MWAVRLPKSKAFHLLSGYERGTPNHWSGNFIEITEVSIFCCRTSRHALLSIPSYLAYILCWDNLNQYLNGGGGLGLRHKAANLEFQTGEQ
jgi:hypothetical protein